MNNVIRHIEYLVRRHDCVVIPSWGAFVARYRSAYYDDVAGLMYPPVREISFNSGIVHDDGLLASSVARRQRISFEKASLDVAKEIEAMKNQLKVDGELTIGKVGRFLYQEESSAMFEPSARTLASASRYMAPVSVRPVIAEARDEARRESEASPLRKRRRFGRMTKRVMKVAASVVALVGIGILLSTPVIMDREDNLASVSVPAVRSVQTSMIPSVSSESGTLNIFIPREPETPVASFKRDDIAVAAVNPVVDSAYDVRMNDTDAYCLVVASLPTKSSAEAFIRENASVKTLGILAQDGKYRVYAATGSTSDEAYGQRRVNGLAERYPDAWVCRRR